MKFRNACQDHQAGESAIKCLSQEHNKNAQVDFKPRPCCNKNIKICPVSRSILKTRDQTETISTRSRPRLQKIGLETEIDLETFITAPTIFSIQPKSALVLNFAPPVKNFFGLPGHTLPSSLVATSDFGGLTRPITRDDRGRGSTPRSFNKYGNTPGTRPEV